jgi:hypothetical protein
MVGMGVTGRLLPAVQNIQAHMHLQRRETGARNALRLEPPACDAEGLEAPHKLADI